MKKIFLIIIILLFSFGLVYSGGVLPQPKKDDKLSVETQQYLQTLYETLDTFNGSISDLESILTFISGSANKIVEINSTENGFTFTRSVSTDGTFTANSDSLVPTEKATKTYVASQIATANGLSNVVFSGILGNIWVGTEQNVRWYSDNATYEEVTWTRFTKIPSINTVTVYAYIYAADENQADCRVTIGTATPLVLSTTSTHITLRWYSGTIDVSGLTNNTNYAVTIELQRGVGGQSVNLKSFIGIAS